MHVLIAASNIEKNIYCVIKIKFFTDEPVHGQIPEGVTVSRAEIAPITHTSIFFDLETTGFGNTNYSHSMKILTAQIFLHLHIKEVVTD